MLKSNPRSTILTEGTFVGRLIRFIGGFRPASLVWSRPIESYVSLDTFSIGFAHFWAETVINVLFEFTTKYKSKAISAWGQDAVNDVLSSKEAMKKYFNPLTDIDTNLPTFTFPIKLSDG